jgi:hypothetical protein
MACGYVLGRVMLKEPSLRQRILWFLGSTLTLAFVVLKRLERIRKSGCGRLRKLARSVAPASHDIDDDGLFS